MPRKILIICVDGLGPEYLELTPTPNLDRMAAAGRFIIGESVIPSVTNVNNVSLITGAPPCVHGITANYWLDRATGQEHYMESPDFLRCPTVLQRAQRRGMSTALLTAKQKLLRLLNAGADYSLAAESPDADMIDKIGPPEDIYAPGINHWLFRALRVVLREQDPDLTYCSTTDGMMHKYPPEAEQSQEHIHDLDAILGEIIAENPTHEVYLTADHGMSAKSRGLDLEKILEAAGIAARAIPIIKDRYVAHHQNLGGAAYVYLDDHRLLEDAVSALEATPGMEAVCPRSEAAAQFELLAERIGDLFVLGDRGAVFGQFAAPAVGVEVRSHGSRYESAVPVLAYNSPASRPYRTNFDLVATLGID